MSAVIALLGYLVFGIFKVIFHINWVGLVAAYAVIVLAYVAVLIWYKRKYKEVK
jgi:membrane protein DedA with SNARE-associated domain